MNWKEGCLMIRKRNTTMIIKKLKQLEFKVQIKNSIPMVFSLEHWLKSDDESPSFGDYVMHYEEKHPNASIIIDDILLQTGMYIDTGLILNADRETLQLFVNLAMQGNEVEYMKEFIKLFRDWMGVDDLEPKSEHIKKLNFYTDQSLYIGDRYLTREECLERSYQHETERYEIHIEVAREVLSESSNPFFLDFFDHYKKLTVEELVERYKDVRFLEQK
jgi:hypothetical protein